MKRYRRDTKRGAIRERTERLHRLFYEMTDDESASYPSRPGPRDLAAREVMIDALIQMGSPRTAEALRRFGRGKLGGTLLHEKIHRTIFKPTARPPYRARKEPKTTWLVRHRSGGPWIALDDHDIFRDGDTPYLFEIGMGFSSGYKVVFSDDLGDALEIAEERWPHLFLDELDDDEVEEVEERGEDVFPHPNKRGVMVRRSDDIAMSEPRALVKARILDPYSRTAVITRPGAQPQVVEYQV